MSLNETLETVIILLYTLEGYDVFMPYSMCVLDLLCYMTPVFVIHPLTNFRMNIINIYSVCVFDYECYIETNCPLGGLCVSLCFQFQTITYGVLCSSWRAFQEIMAQQYPPTMDKLKRMHYI